MQGRHSIFVNWKEWNQKSEMKQHAGMGFQLWVKGNNQMGQRVYFMATN